MQIRPSKWSRLEYSEFHIGRIRVIWDWMVKSPIPQDYVWPIVYVQLQEKEIDPPLYRTLWPLLFSQGFFYRLGYRPQTDLKFDVS